MANTYNLGTDTDITALKRPDDFTMFSDDSDDENEMDETPVDNDDQFLMEMMNQQETITEPVLTKEEVIYKRQLIMTIKSWIVGFPHVLQEFKDIDLKSESIASLENINEEVEFIVSNRNSNNNTIDMFATGVGIVEKMGSKLNMELDGLTSVMLSQQNVRDLITEISIKNSSYMYVRPELRLIVTLGVTMKMVDGMNKKNKIVNNFMDKEIQEELVDEFEDL